MWVPCGTQVFEFIRDPRNLLQVIHSQRGLSVEQIALIVR
jgi:hypothetical protein